MSFNSNGEITYYIDISPSQLNYSQTDNVSQSKTLSVLSSQSGLEEGGYVYQIQMFCSTNQYGYDVFEIDGQTTIDNLSNSSWVDDVIIKTKDLTNVPNGYYTGTFSINISKKLNNEPWEIVSFKTINLSLNVALPTSYNFSVNKTSDTVHYTRGNNTSTTSVLNVISDTDYIVSGPAYILLNGEILPKTLPAGNRQLTFSIAASNQLEYGLNTASISFRKVNQNLGTFVLNALQTNTVNLETSTDYLELSHLESIGFSDWQTIIIYEPNPTIITKPDWIEIHLESNISNVKTYKIRSISDQNIAVGNYSENLIVSDGINELSVLVDFELYSYWNSNFDREIHFTKEKQTLNLSSYQRQENNYIQLTLGGILHDCLRGRLTIDTIQNVYFFENKAEFNIGEYLDRYYDLFQNQVDYFDFRSNNSAIKKMYEIGKIDIKVSEINYETENQVYGYELPAQLYLKGHRPKTLNQNNTGILSNQTNKIGRATKNSKVIVHFLTKQINSEINVYVNQELVETFQANELNRLSIYSLYYDFSTLDLKPGNMVDIVMGNQAMQYQIIPSTAFTNHIIYIDYWGLPQIWELIGGYDYAPKESYSIHRNSKNHHKNIAVEEELKLKWNTGYYFRTDIPRIKEIAHSKNCWMLKGNEIIEITPAFESFEMFSTDNFLYSSELEFYINVEDYDASYTN